MFMFVFSDNCYFFLEGVVVVVVVACGGGGRAVSFSFSSMHSENERVT